MLSSVLLLHNLLSTSYYLISNPVLSLVGNKSNDIQYNLYLTSHHILLFIGNKSYDTTCRCYLLSTFISFFYLIPHHIPLYLILASVLSYHASYPPILSFIRKFGINPALPIRYQPYLVHIRR